MTRSSKETNDVGSQKKGGETVPPSEVVPGTQMEGPYSS